MSNLKICTLISLDYVDFWPKVHLILYPSLGNLKTHNIAINLVNTTIAIKLMDANKSPEKLYKVTIATTGEVSIKSMFQGNQLFFGTFNRQTNQVSERVLDPLEFSPDMFQGFFVR